MTIRLLIAIVVFAFTRICFGGEIYCDGAAVEKHWSKLTEENRARLSKEQCMSAEYAGKILRGDLEKIEAFLRKQPIMYLYLNSRGGDLHEAIRIGRIVRQNNLLTFIHGEDAACSSACFFIWAAGVYRTGDPSIHRPYLSDNGLASQSMAQASEIYTAITSEIESYLAELRIDRHLPNDFVSRMMATRPNDAFFLSEFTDEAPGLLATYEPGIEQYLLDTCGSLNNNKCELNQLLRSRILER